MNSQVLESAEYIMRRRNGATFPALMHSSVTIRDNKATGFRGAAIDITGLKEAEEVAKQNRLRLDMMLNQVPCVLWTTDTELVITSSLGSGLARLGFQPGEVVGMSLFDYFNTDDPQFPGILAHQQALSGEQAGYDLSWAGRSLYCHVEPLRDSNGSIIGVVGVGFDITKRKQTEEQLTTLSRRLIEIQEEERRTIARELHDQVGQSLNVVNLLLQRAASPTEQDNGPLLNEAQAQIGELVHYIRNLSLDLRPTMLDDLGLLDTLIWYLGRYSANTKVQVAFKHYGLGRPMEPQIATTVYRVVQEALTNVARHAGVDHAILRVWAARHAVYLQVEDNGTGFDPSALAAGNSCGITGMRERVALVGGNLSVESTPGAGTCVTAEIPLEKVDDGHKET